MKTLYFAHGAGIPASTYQKMLNHLKPYYNIVALEMFGHNVRYPVTHNWPYLVDEMIAHIESISFSKPVIAIGHSMGGVLVCMAQKKRPDLFEAIIALDSFLVSPYKLRLLQLAKYVGGIHYLTPAGRTKNRCNYWENFEIFEKYLHSRKFFTSWDKECLRDYMKAGVKETSNGLTLAFNREIEYQLYCTIPHAFKNFKINNTPILRVLLHGKQSEILKLNDVKAAKHYYNMECIEVQGSHMFPLEYPLQTAEKIHEILRKNVLE